MFAKDEVHSSGIRLSELESDTVDCCGCFGFLRKPRKETTVDGHFFGKHYSEEHLLSYSSDGSTKDGRQKRRENGLQPSKSMPANSNGVYCRETPVRETHRVVRIEDPNGNKMINEYVRECKIGTGSYGKVVLHRSTKDGKRYAIKAFHKSRLSKLRVAPSETAMTDVLREVSIMKKLDHPNIVNLVEVIDDPDTDHFYMVMEYVEGRWICEGSGPPGGIGEATARRYFRDVVAGLMYLHSHNIVHGDIKPENLLVDSNGRVKIGDFSVSRSFEDNNDELRRSPGTPVFTAPECCLGLTYHGKAADVWALGVTLYCMVLGRYPFIGETLQDTYDRIVHDELLIPEDMDPELSDLLQGLLCKDPKKRFTLDVVARHPWAVKGYGPVQHDLWRCEHGSFVNLSEQDAETETDSGDLCKSA
uniref:non-specific serine/threonine protein kinase n=1 Tax=Wollemia nobilis TaxID=56998 RepID=A0A0C9SA08_9CONI